MGLGNLGLKKTLIQYVPIHHNFYELRRNLQFVNCQFVVEIFIFWQNI